MRLYNLLGSTTVFSLGIASAIGIVAPANAALLNIGDTAQFGGTIVYDGTGGSGNFTGNARLFCPINPITIINPSPNCPGTPNLDDSNPALTGITNIADNANDGYFNPYDNPNSPPGFLYKGKIRSFDDSTFNSGTILNFIALPQISDSNGSVFASVVSLNQLSIIESFASNGYILNAEGTITLFDDVNNNLVLDTGEVIKEKANVDISLSSQRVNFTGTNRTRPRSFSATIEVTSPGVVPSVPEPSTTVGLFAVVGLATSGVLKNKANKK